MRLYGGERGGKEGAALHIVPTDDGAISRDTHALEPEVVDEPGGHAVIKGEDGCGPWAREA